MKRTLSDNCEKNKKQCCLNPPLPTSQMTDILEHFQDIALHLDKGELDYCITKRAPNTENTEYDSIARSLHTALKSIAQKQLKLETENLRFRIAIKQQHHLLTLHDNYHSIEQDDPEEEEDDDDDDDDDEDEQHNLDLIVNTDTHNIVKDVQATPEDNLDSFRESPMIDKLQLSSIPGK
jgi:antitoxin component of MazEF toxin-antitoxin module